MKKLSTILLGWLFTAVAVAQDNHLVMQFNFDNVDGTTVTDAISGIEAEMENGADVITLGDYRVLDLGSGNGYLDMTASAGTLLRGLDNFSISAYYLVGRDASLSGNGYFLWAFSTVSENTETSGAYTAYRLNVQRMATSPSGWGSETGIEMGVESPKGTWIHVLYRQNGTNGELFINGNKVLTAPGMPTLKNNFSSGIPYCWIGRAPFAGDSYLRNTLVSDFRLYDTAVDDETVQELYGKTALLEEAFRYGTPGDFSDLVETLETCRTFVDGATEGYAPNAVVELEDEMKIAQKEVEDGRASQDLIEQYIASLEALLARAEGTKGFTPKKVFDYKAGEQGFVHPGALVTQADIDRAKELIAQGDDKMVRAWQILCSNQYAQSGVATWPTEYIVRGIEGDNYMNAARGAAMAFQNALRWKIGGTREHADAAVRILMQWCRATKGLGGNTNISLASGIYGYEFANAAELMRDYDGWSREEFEEFKRWMVKVFYNPAIDFLRRRHDTWANFRHPSRGERPGHYWSNWGLCNVLSVMSIGILCDDVHMYNQGVSFYKYDHQGTYEDRTNFDMIINDGCNEFIGNLVPVVLPDERGPFGFLGQMQESGRDQGHSLMALGCALDVCQIGFNQGDDLFAYWDDRIAAGTEYVAAQNFGGVAPTDLPWILYEYADCAGPRGASWKQPCADSRGVGEWRPMWDRAIGYYHGLRGVKLQYASIASDLIGPDGGGGNYSPNSGGFDHLGFTTLTHWRPMIDKSEAITPLTGDIIYKGETLKNQTNLGGLKYRHERGASKAIPADGADITLIPQLPEGCNDTGKWQWNTGETTRQITVKADRSYIYRVTYTAENGKQSQQSFAIAVAGDAQADEMRKEITVDGVIMSDTTVTVLSGKSLLLFAEATTGWTDDYVWDNGSRGTLIELKNITNTRTYTCQFASQSGAVSEARFLINVVPARQQIVMDGGSIMTDRLEVYPGSNLELLLEVAPGTNTQDILWHDGSKGATFAISDIREACTATATFKGVTYTYHITLREAAFSYITDILTKEKGYKHVLSKDMIEDLAADHYFVLCADEADLMVRMDNGKHNGNKALFYTTSADPATLPSTLFTMEPFNGGFCLRNIDFDGLLLQTEGDMPWHIRTHDQPVAIDWARFLFEMQDDAWTVENGMYPGNWLGLWSPENGYNDGQELACNKTGESVAGYQIFAISKKDFHGQYLATVTPGKNYNASILIQNPMFTGNSWVLWNVAGTFGNQNFNGAAEVWHSIGFQMSQTLEGLLPGLYTVTCQMVNGEGNNTGCLFATAGDYTATATVKASCAGSNFDAERDNMSASSRYGRLEVEIVVPEDGKLTFGIKEPSDDTTWLVFDNFKLTYEGDAPDGIRSPVHDVPALKGIYDLTGRKLRSMPTTKGIYIIDGKKVSIR